MKSFLTVIFFSLTYVTIAQEANEAIRKTEDYLTDGDKKSWVFYRTVETMGSKHLTLEECTNDTLTFELNSKTYTGQICSVEYYYENTWRIEGSDPFEQYIVMGERYMIDIYKKTIDGEKVQVLRLKQISKSKSIPSIAHLYKEVK